MALGSHVKTNQVKFVTYHPEKLETKNNLISWKTLSHFSLRNKKEIS